MNEFTITEVRAREIIDNRGMPTLRVAVVVEDHFTGRADVPCGSSTGGHEAFDLRDGGSRYRGRGVQKALHNIRELIRPALLGQDATRQRDLDRQMVELDGTPDKSKLGGNAILGVSLATARAAAAACGLPLYRYLNAGAHVLPVPQACLINGGQHAGNDLDVQEFCVMPVGAPSAAEAIRMLSETFYTLKDVLREKMGKAATNFSEDGGFAPPMRSTREAMDVLMEAVGRAGFADQMVYGLDLASTGFFDPNSNRYAFDGAERSREAMIAHLKDILREYPDIVSIEDPLHDDDLEGWRLLTRELQGTLIIGDDLFATNVERLRLGIEAGAANATLCKLNQIGSLTEAMDAAHYAERHGYPVVMSERSGETEDDILSDISVALNAGLFKTGGLQGSDRGTNYNRFIEIEEELGLVARYAGRDYRRLE